MGIWLRQKPKPLAATPVISAAAAGVRGKNSKVDFWSFVQIQVCSSVIAAESETAVFVFMHFVAVLLRTGLVVADDTLSPLPNSEMAVDSLVRWFLFRLISVPSVS